MVNRKDRDFILAIDQGTTSTRAIVFDRDGRPVASAGREFKQFYPFEGGVEHDSMEIWQSTLSVCRDALAQDIGASKIAAIGITNQRETTVIWDRQTGAPIHNAIVWQDRRTADRCRALKEQNLEHRIVAKTGLLADPYFSATKVAWILDHVPGARAKAQRGELAFGTIDSWLIWNLTKGDRHVTDVTNASRTLLFNIHDLTWDDDLLEWLDVPHNILPEVQECVSDFGQAHADHFGQTIPILGVAGDQHAATVGQACLHSGMAKSTYGTGCFILLNTGDKCVSSQARLLSTIAYGVEKKITYALEGSIFVAGAALQWLRDELGFFTSASETEHLAQAAGETSVYVVPAFVGLGAPHWDPYARGAIYGLTRDTGIPDIVRATLDSVCYQTQDLIKAMEKDTKLATGTLRVDGGMAANHWFLQRLADLTGCTVERPHIIETTALGSAYLAAMGAGLIAGLDEIEAKWSCAASFEPRLSADQRTALNDGWQRAVTRTLSVPEERYQ